MSALASWGFAEGDEITAELTAVRRLGGGSGYEAYLAFDEITYGPVVVKVVRPDQVADEHSLRGLAREVEALATVNHPVVVRGLRHELAGDRPHVVLEQLDGPRLSTLVRRYGPLPEQQYLPLAIEVASALHYLGRIGWVHLDVKPSNVIMGAPARLIDLSVARPLADAAGTRRIGTDAYMSPEQWDPDRYGVPTPAADVWGLGATLFEAVAGYRAVDLPTDEPAVLPDRVPAEVAKTITACLELRPDDRPVPCEVAEALEPVLDRQPAVRLN
jgi:eukaryotic-like serine/threonine-protein kinase